MARARRSAHQRRRSTSRRTAPLRRFFRRRHTRQRGWQGRLLAASRRLGLTIVLVILPFWLLVRGAVLAHESFGMNAWIGLGFGVACASPCLALSAAWHWNHLTGRRPFREIAARIALPLVLLFSIYSLAWLSSWNAKSEEVRALYSQLHPSLRLAISTAILADPDVVVTDIARSPKDYRPMGLRAIRDSLHFEQADGWIHAVDLRTRDRSAVRNALLRIYFRGMGFHALRHGGSGDHLHISLPRRQTGPSSPGWKSSW